MRKQIILVILFVMIISNHTLGQNDDSWKVYDDSEVAVIKITMDDSDLQYMYNNVESDSVHQCFVHFKNAVIDETIDSVGIRLRGNTSRFSQKKSLKLSFNSFISGEKLYSLEKLNFNGEHNDPSIARSKISWDLFNQIKVVSSRSSYAAVYINEVYYGLYLSVEHIDENFVDKNFNDDSGNLWKCLYGADLNYISNDPNRYKMGGDSRVYDLKTNTEIDDYTKLAELINFLNNSDDETFRNQLAEKFDLLNLLQVFAVNVITGMWDDYWANTNNYYLYFEPSQNKFYIIPYDYDNTFGVNWFGTDWSQVNPYTFNKINNGYRPLIERTLEFPEFRNLYTRILNFIKNSKDETSLYNYNIYLIQSMIRPWAEDDIYRMMDYGFTIDNFNDSFFSSDYSFNHVDYSIQEFINRRFESLESELYYQSANPIIYDYEVTPRYLVGNDTILVGCSGYSNIGVKSIKAELINLQTNITSTYELSTYHNLGSLDLRERDSWDVKISDLSDAFSGTLQFIVEDSNGTVIHYPQDKIAIRSAGEVTKEILISEVMSSNTTTIMDQNGEFEDWIEIYNPQENAVFLSGMYLTDKISNLRKWQFPQNVRIRSKQSILIWCDEDQEQGNDHTNFKLSSGGEFLAIVDNDGVTIVDSVSFPALEEDQVYARENDNGNWRITNSSTPGISNILTNVDNNINIRHTYSLGAYPNPFNPSTNIEYEITIPANLELKIFDVLGREVWSLRKENMPVGKHSVNWDGVDNNGRELATGIYLLNFNSSLYNKTIKLVLLR